jgi:hypothetical protein
MAHAQKVQGLVRVSKILAFLHRTRIAKASLGTGSGEVPRATINALAHAAAKRWEGGRS